MGKLLIVESPSKAKHIAEMLGHGWVVKASLGHIRDLPVKGEAAFIRPPDFKMVYEVTDAKHQEIVNDLKKAVHGATDGVYIATDPDREGEAIGWHLCKALQLDVKTTPRVKYNEVTESAIKKAIADAGKLDMKLVAAQEARRALDRMVGWEVSGPLSRTIGTKASAGRVQTPALRLIVERERKILGFKSTNYFEIRAHFKGNSGEWTALWQTGLPDGEYFQDEDFAKKLVQNLSDQKMVIKSASAGPAKMSPPPPFTTSSMQMDASRTLRWPLDKVMQVAQSLFEKGYITYHRTDSPNLSEDGEVLLRKHAEEKGWPLSPSPRRWNAKGDAQEAHEAIRPTFEHSGVSGLTDEEQKLYDLIYRRAVASQLADAIYREHKVTLDAGELQEHKLIFKASGRVLKEKGWKVLYEEGADDVDEDEKKEAAESLGGASNPVPDLSQSIGDTVSSFKGSKLDRKTRPPKRYTQATLVAELEKHGVGRPSTYASIIQTLIRRTFVQMKKQDMVPTDLGMRVTDALVDFDFAGVDYTRDIESTLDHIAQGQARPHDLLHMVFDSLQATLKTLKGAAPTTPCPVDGCDGEVRRLESKKSKGFYFWVCSAKDDAGESKHGILSDNNGEPGEIVDFSKPKQEHGEGDGPACSKCKKPTNGRKTATGKLYYKCFSCNKTWWPDKENQNKLGTLWK